MKKSLFPLAGMILLACLSFSGAVLAAKTEPAAQSVAQPVSQAPDSSTKAPVSQVASVNINTASVEELQKSLKGIGKVKAQAIVDYRTSNGPFTTVDQLLEVKGIGKGTLDKNRERISL